MRTEFDCAEYDDHIVDEVEQMTPMTSHFFMLNLCLLVCLLIFSTEGRARIDSLEMLTQGQPQDVAAMAERIVLCSHFAGEEPYDAQRRKEIAMAMRRYRCEKLDQDEAALRKRYRSNSAIADILQKAHEW